MEPPWVHGLTLLDINVLFQHSNIIKLKPRPVITFLQTSFKIDCIWDYFSFIKIFYNNFAFLSSMPLCMHAHDPRQSSAVKKLKSKIDQGVYKGIFHFRFTTITRKDNIIMETAAGKADNRIALITLLGLGILWIRIHSHHQPALIQSILAKYQWFVCPCKDIVTASPVVFIPPFLVPFRIMVLLW